MMGYPVTIVKVDEKGRILLPKDLRKRAGIRDSAQVELEEGKIVITAESLLDNLATHPIGFTTGELPKLRKMAFEQGLKETRRDLKDRPKSEKGDPKRILEAVKSGDFKPISPETAKLMKKASREFRKNFKTRDFRL